LVDYKSTITLCDLSTQDEDYGVPLSIFRPEADMPQVDLGDVLVITTAKVQKYHGPPSLITNVRTSIRVYAASKIPRPPKSVRIALASGPKRDSHAPTTAEEAYVSHIHHAIDKYSLPDEHQFQQKAAQSLNVKRKFSLLKDVKEGGFYDLVVQVAKDPYAGPDLVTLYVSDYTENPHFHPQIWQGFTDMAPEGGDPYGYTSGSANQPTKDWVGPYGKMSIQLSCFEPHGTYILDEVRAGQWVSLRNVQIKYGRDGQFLEGFMRGERNVDNTRINVQTLEADDGDVDPDFKEAVRRWRDYDKKKKKQIKAAQAAGLKRKASLPSEQEQRPLNTSERRKRRRAQQKEKEKAAPEQKEEAELANQDLRLCLNSHITCETHNTPYSTIASILEHPVHESTVNDETTAITMPFTCAKYRAQVRVVDFFPSALEDFACRKVADLKEMVLSDHEDDSSCPSSSDDEDGPGAGHVWEWRFALQLEDPAPPTNTHNDAASPRPRVWVFVDNSEAQCLTGLDATDLRRDPRTLAQLRERMFNLWGNLEEHKARAAEKETQSKQRKPGPGEKANQRLRMPPLQSSPAEDGGESRVEQDPVSNKPFACCIKQYGVYEKESGKAGKWVRCFGLFGTKICA
jgi:hypothetical protein